MKLFERQAAVRLDEAHLLGNGRMGASVYGGVPFEEILINDDTLWSGRESYRVNEEFYDRLQQARTLALSGEDKAAEEIINSGMEGSWTESYMPSVRMILQTELRYRSLSTMQSSFIRYISTTSLRASVL